MKKLYFLFCTLACSYASFAQTIDNADFETWRHNTSGSPLSINIHAPTMWNGLDSLAISGLQAFAPFLFEDGYMPTALKAQLFQESAAAHVHGGSSSAKIITVRQDTVGLIPGSLANAKPDLNLAGGTTLQDFLIFRGGTPTNLRITSVSAYIQYFPGKDSITGLFGGNDSGTIVVQASSSMSGAPTIVGTGTLTVGSTPTFTQYTVNLTYTDTVNFVDSVRIIFSSGREINNLDSSIMYIDDVSMAGIAQVSAVPVVNAKADLVKVYPNPASGTIYLNTLQNKGLTCELISVSGQVVATKALTGSDALDVSGLASGTYFYSITDEKGNKVQRGNLTIKN